MVATPLNRQSGFAQKNVIVAWSTVSDSTVGISIQEELIINYQNKESNCSSEVLEISDSVTWH